MSIARREVEQTLRLAQDEVERDIAVLRLMLFLLTAVIGTIIHIAAWGDNIFFPVFFWSCTVVNAVMWLAVRRFGATGWLRLGGLCFEIGAPAIVCIRSLFDDPGDAQGQIYSLMILTAAMFTLQITTALRSSRAASLFAALVATAVFVGAVHFSIGMHPLLSFVVLLLLCSGYASVSMGKRVRRNLDRFARLLLLKRYLPSIAVDRVLAERMDEALSVGGQQVTVTLLSTDLRGFTAMSETLQPEQVVEQLNAYHAMMLEEVRRHGGILDKFIGDGMLAIFGLGMEDGKLTSVPDAGAQAALACARAMLQALETLNVTRAGQGLLPLRVGAGLHTGPVIAGNIGVPGHRIEFTVIGDAVNTAARLEGLTKEAGTPVLISGETSRRLSEPTGLVPRPPVTLRGKSQPLEVFMLAQLN
jgi:adenylate cyclase